jgi:retron-type reverse transcriptase
MILDTIYDPMFTKKHLDSNYGFRKEKSTHQAIDKLKMVGVNLEWVIEGDIKGAYDNINHDIMKKILLETISDTTFVDFIVNGMKSGAIHKGHFENTFLGTPQGGIASPILFNIYIHV